MITKELIKEEIDKINEKYLEILYKFIKTLEPPSGKEIIDSNTITDVTQKDKELDWHDFIEKTYGCLSDDPIERGDQGVYEIREEIE